MASSEKRCYYEVLGLSRDCTPDEIRSAYRRLALQRHPDKLVQGGVPEAEATAAFQELVNAYEVLSDPKERAWYDSHRNQILFSSASAAGDSSSFVPDLFSFFSNSVYSGYSDSGRGFYKVYGDLFEKIYANELNFAKKLGLPLPKEAPVIGNLESPYAQVTAFYNYWLGFVTVMDFFWADQYDVMAGPNRKSRRLMEEENKKLRKKARREYNETVRGLAEFVKKRDKRVIDMQIKRNEEMERKKEQERQRKKELERQKQERAMNYEEPDWAKVEDVDNDETEDEVDEKKSELYCLVCRKKFKNDNQWKNHEQSKKHKEKIADLRQAFSEEDKEFEATAVHENGTEEDKDVDGDSASYLSADESLNELRQQFEDGVHIHKDDTDEGKTESSEADGLVDFNSSDGQKKLGADLGSDEDEASVLEAMLSGHKNRTRGGKKAKASVKKLQTEIDNDALETMEYNDMKGSRRNKGGRRRRGRRQEEEEEEGKEEQEEAESTKVGLAEKNDETDRHDEQDDVKESNSLPEKEDKRKADDATENGHKPPQQSVNKKHTKKKENAPKPIAANKGRKQKVAADDYACEKCGEQFYSRNKLHRHLSETGHASLRRR